MDRTIDPRDILSLDEVRSVLLDGERRARRAAHTRQNLVIFRLACCCGLRASEIAGLELRDLQTGSAAPHIAVRREVTKRTRRPAKGRKRVGKARAVPLAWDEGTLRVLTAWKAAREAAGAQPTDPVVCVRTDRPQAAAGRITPDELRSHVGRPLTREQVARKFKAALRPLPAERRRELHTHSGRHTWATYMAREHELSAVRDAAGHASIATTSIYLHADPAEFTKPGSVFTFAPDSSPKESRGAPAAPPPSPI